MHKIVAGISLNISEPYSSGQTLGPTEAKVLNKIRAKNFTNTIRSKVADLIQEELSEEQIQTLVTDMDSCYVPSSSSILDPIEREALKLAADMVKSHLLETGRRPSICPPEFSEDEWQEKISNEIDRVAETPAVVELATKNVEARRKSSSSIALALDVLPADA